VIAVKALPDQLAPWALRDQPDFRPRLSRTAVGFAALALLTLAIGYAAGLAWPTMLIAPVSLAILGLIQTVLAWDDLAQRRRSADRWFRLRPVLLDDRYAWRAAELTSPGERRVLARSLDGLVDELDGRVVPGPVPLNTQGLRLYSSELDALADRIADLERPVTPAGILAVHEFLQSPGSPVYERTRSETLPLVLLELNESLEPR
jgi:hypothetical protein